MKIEDIIVLGKMGFTAEQVKQFMALETPAAPAAAAPAAPAAAAPAAPAAAVPAVSNPWDALSRQVADLTAAVQASKIPSAGTVGSVPPVTSVEDIILGAVNPAPAPASPDFSKGV